MVWSNAGTTGKSKAKWVLWDIVIAVFTVNVIWWYDRTNRRHLSERRRDALTPEQRWTKFSTKYLERVSFPEKYDGQPSPDAPPEKRAKIVDVQENVTKEGDPTGSRHNVLIVWITASDFPSGRVEVKHWFDQDTGMLEERRVQCKI